LAFPTTGGRFDLLEDHLTILHGLWSSASGSMFEHSGLTCSVRLEADPLRPPRHPPPPIIVGGGGGPRGARLAATFADEFNTPFVSLDEMKARYGSVRRACEKLGRDPASLVWSAAHVLCCGRS